MNCSEIDKDILLYIQNLEERLGCKFNSVIIIGSFAYPEFVHKNSDVDLLLVLREKPVIKEELIHDYSHIGGLNRRIECRAFSDEALFNYVLTCDIAKLYAFVRGFTIILDNEERSARASIEIAIQRYYTEAANRFAEMKQIGLSQQINNTRFYMEDARSSLTNTRLEGNVLFQTLRRTEILRDYIGNVWIALILQRFGHLRVTSVERNCTILNEVGLFNVFCGTRGGRIADHTKYPKNAVIENFMSAIDSFANSDNIVFFNGMNELFYRLFQSDLFLEASFRKTFRQGEASDTTGLL